MTKKRANGEGSIYKIRNRWRGLVTIDGRRVSFCADSKKEISDWIKKTTHQIDRGLTYQGSKVKFDDYLSHWLFRMENAIRPSTYSNYKILCKKYLIPNFGRLLLKDLTADYIQFIYDEWYREGVGVYTILKTHAILHHALVQAEKIGIIPHNPARLVQLPRLPYTEMRFWSDSEANRFLMIAKEDRLYALFYLAIVTGIRQMELLGLQWTDLDWQRATLLVCRQLTRTKKEMFSSPKTRAGKRSLHLGAGTLAILREHYERQNLERRIAGDDWKDHNLIFTNLRGNPVDYKTLVDHHFRPLVKKASVPTIRFHDLRHTAVSIMLSKGIPIFVVSKIIGHARPSITSDTYGHLAPEAMDGIGDIMDELLISIPVNTMLMQDAES